MSRTQPLSQSESQPDTLGDSVDETVEAMAATKLSSAVSPARSSAVAQPPKQARSAKSKSKQPAKPAQQPAAQPVQPPAAASAPEPEPESDYETTDDELASYEARHASAAKRLHTYENEIGSGDRTANPLLHGLVYAAEETRAVVTVSRQKNYAHEDKNYAKACQNAPKGHGELAEIRDGFVYTHFSRWVPTDYCLRPFCTRLVSGKYNESFCGRCQGFKVLYAAGNVFAMLEKFMATKAGKKRCSANPQLVAVYFGLPVEAIDKRDHYKYLHTTPTAEFTAYDARVDAMMSVARSGSLADALPSTRAGEMLARDACALAIRAARRAERS